MSNIRPKPIPTLKRALKDYDIRSVQGNYQRGEITKSRKRGKGDGGKEKSWGNKTPSKTIKKRNEKKVSCTKKGQQPGAKTPCKAGAHEIERF